MTTNLNNSLDLIYQWTIANRLSLNTAKTNYQIYSRSVSRDLNISMNNTNIQRKSCVNYLGVLIDENLKWNSHIAYVSSVTSRNLGIMGRAKPYLLPRELLLLYNTLVLPHINYCALIWGMNYQSNISKLLILQKTSSKDNRQEALFSSIESPIYQI